MTEEYTKENVKISGCFENAKTTFIDETPTKEITLEKLFFDK